MMHDSFLSDLSSPERPAPGGGAAAAHAGAVALALLEKIVRVEMRRRQSVSGRSLWEDLLDQISSLTQSLYRLRDEDGMSYMRLAETKTSGKKEAVILAALKEAIDCPMKIMEETHKALGHVSQTAQHCKKHLLSDLLVVCEILEGANRAAGHIARANLRLMADPILKADYQNRLSGLNACGCEALKGAEASIIG
jgi:formiminotetrahydrofolate cyclodeaminase